MLITLNVADRKPLVKLLSEHLSEKAVYMRTPTYAFKIGTCVVTREGNLELPDDLQAEALQGIYDVLKDAGYQPQELSAEDAEQENPAGEPESDGSQYEDSAAENVAEAEPQADGVSDTVEQTEAEPAEPQGASVSQAEEPMPDGEPIGLTVSVPKDKVNMYNLKALLTAKGTLIKRALGIDDLPFVETDETVSFPWFQVMPDSDSVKAYTNFIAAMCEMSVKQRSILPYERPIDNEKYQFRGLLLRLGFNGPEHKTDRSILMRKLSGNCAWKSVNGRQPRPTDDPDEPEEVVEAIPDAEPVGEVPVKVAERADRILPFQ